MANNRKRTRGRKFNYQTKLVEQSTAFGVVLVPSKHKPVKVFQIPLAGCKTHNASNNSNFRD
jgi:hypothetical protein